MRDTIFLPFLPFLFFLGSASSAITTSDPLLLPFGQPLVEEPYYADNTTSSPDFELKLLKRQSNACVTGYTNCATLGAPGLCCHTTEVCAQDSGGNVACCRTQASCTGTIRPATTTAGGGTIVVVGASTTATTQSAGTSTGTTGTSAGIVFVGSSGTTGSAQQTSGAGLSYVNNPYFPYAYIPTTYADAAACSSAYTTCHADFATCSSYLAGVSGAFGVTVSVSGGGGTTVVQSAAPTTYPATFASSVCASLSGSACYGLTVEACAAFGTPTAVANGAAAAKCTGMGYAAGVGAGIALGVMGYR